MNCKAKCKRYTLDEIMAREPDPEEWELRNDMVKKVTVQCCEYGFLSLGIDYVSGRQGVGYGHANNSNIGLMIHDFADLLGVGYINGDVMEAMRNKPIRVMFKTDYGGRVVDSTYIGNFMEDKFIKMSELVLLGLDKEEK